MSTATKFSPHDIRTIAVKALVDPRSVRRFMSGGRQPPLVADRIRAAVSELWPEALVALDASKQEAPHAA